MPTTDKTKLYPDMLVLVGGVWYVEYEGSQDEQFIKGLFGATCLPTPFSGQWFTKEDVCRKLEVEGFK